MADRYCRNCGHELAENDRFCPNCGSPVQEVAHVPTPEADVPVPPPPQQAGEIAPPPQQAGVPQQGWRQNHPIFTGCLAIIVLLVLLGIIGAAFGGGGDETAGDSSGGGGGGEVADKPQQKPAEQKQAEQPERQGQQQQEQQQPEQEKQQANESQEDVYSVGEVARVGDVSYKVTSAERVTQLKDPYGIEPPMRGNFILVTFVFTNDGDDPATVSDIGLYLYDSQGREFETDTDAAFYLPQDKSIFLLDRVNPGLSKTVQTVYSVPPDAQGFELEVTSGFWQTETARIKLGF